VPDKGTVLIGGMKVTREEDVKSGVPFLENVPILSFIFGRKGRVHNRSTLLILVRAEVTLLEEVETVSAQMGSTR
jgi:type II secretory pathway component GspD/PulD (secretin)